jgi:hypothetical protein
MSVRTFLGFFAILALIGFIGWYALFQARFLIAGPQITLNDNLDVVQTERTITIRGNAENIVKITLNGLPISTNEDGVFTESLVLESGYTIMTLHAEDRYGRETSLARSFVYTPTTSIN